MREIKYRQAIFKDGKFWQWHYRGYVNGPYFILPFGPMDDDPRPSYQYTGLKDKNGQEIYEGDKCRECFYISRFIEDVSQRGSWRKIHEGIKGHWQTNIEQREIFEVHSIEGILDRIMELRDVVDPKDVERLESGGFFEVIGNIYESPSLLEEKA